MEKFNETKTWIAGLQWFFFMFANIVVIPITVGEAFELSEAEIVALLQLSFIVTGLACLLQVLFGHKRPLMEGQSGLWWGIFLTLVTTSSAQGMTLSELGGSLALGVIIAGVITILVGICGLGPLIAKMFTTSVMGVFMFLLGLTLIQIFLKGMLGIPFGNAENAMINMPVAALGIMLALFVILISIKFPAKIRSYALLIGIIVGWVLYRIIFGNEATMNSTVVSIKIFPLGNLQWNTGIVMTTIIAALLNTSNTFGALKGSDALFEKSTTKKDYVTSFSFTGIATVAAGLFGLVPYAPFVSSIGFLRQTDIYGRLPFIIGSLLFFTMGVFQPISIFFSTLPLSIGSAVLFVAYLQLFVSSMDFFKQMSINTLNVYRVAIPVFVGAIIMTFPAAYFEALPAAMRPFLSNGLLVGIVLALIFDNLLRWERIAPSVNVMEKKD